MLAGIISKLLKAISNEFRYENPKEHIHKKILGKEWFIISQEQLNLYKKLYNLLCKKNDWFKFFSGMYSDNLITIVSLLNYMDQFETNNDIGDSAMHSE